MNINSGKLQSPARGANGFRANGLDRGEADGPEKPLDHGQIRIPLGFLAAGVGEQDHVRSDVPLDELDHIAVE